MAQVLTITSGKGGVGKTNISANLAIQLASQGHRTCLFDADLGLANVNILLKLYPEHDLEDVLFGDGNLEDILIKEHYGVDIIPGSSGVEKLADLDQGQMDQMLEAFAQLEDYDYILFDTSAGISRNVMSFCMAASQVILVITPEPTSLTDAYALLKVLAHNGYTKPVMVVVNLPKNVRIAKLAYNKLKDTVEKFLPISIRPLGTVFHDPEVVEAVKDQEPFLLRTPQSLAAKCIQRLAGQLIKKSGGQKEDLGLEQFWEKWIDLFQGELNLTGGLGKAKSTSKSAPTPMGSSGEAGQPKSATPASIAEKSPSPMNPDMPVKEMVQAMGEAFEKLSGSIDAVARELAGIKNEIGLNGTRPAQGMEVSEVQVQAPLPPIKLDFNAYLDQHQKGQ